MNKLRFSFNTLFYFLLFFIVWGVVLGAVISDYGKTITSIVDIYSVIAGFVMFPTFFLLGFLAGQSYCKDNENKKEVK